MATNREPENEQGDANGEGGIGSVAVHMAVGGAEAEVVALAVPKEQPCRCGRGSEQPQVPGLRAMAEHFATIADSTKRAETDVEAVGEQAESGEESQQKRPVQSQPSRDCPNEQRGSDADDRTGPHNDQWASVNC